MNAAQYVSRLRKRLKEGEPLSADDHTYLSEYEKRVKRGRKRAPAPPLPSRSPDAPPSVSADSPVAEPPADTGESADLPPIDMGGFDPEPEEAPKADPPKEKEAGSSSFGAGAGSNADGAGGAREESDPPRSEAPKVDFARKKMCDALAIGYGKWMIGQHIELAKLGIPALPPEIIAGFIVPCASRAAYHFLPDIQSIYADAAVAVIPGIYTVVAARRARMVGKQDPAKAPEKPQRPNARVIQMGPPAQEKKQPAKEPVDFSSTDPEDNKLGI